MLGNMAIKLASCLGFLVSRPPCIILVNKSHFWAIVNMLLDLRVLQEVENFLSSLASETEKATKTEHN